MSLSLRRIAVVFTKEAIDNLRDRRSLASALVSSLIGPLIIVVMIMVLGKTVIQEVLEKPLSLPVVGAEYAPALIQFLEQNNVTIQPAPLDPEEQVRRGDLEVVLIISEDYAEDFRSGQPATVHLVVDSSRQSAMPEVERARALLNYYQGQIANLRLLARGISPVITNTFTVEMVDVSTPQSQVLIFLNMMPYFIILVVFVGGMHVIVDATAGERERGSLEPLLINPVRRAEFVLGKLAASIPFAMFSTLVTLLAFAVAFNLVPLEDYIGFQISIDPLALVGIFLIALPMIFLASGLQMIIASFSRSFKEAQTYTGFLPLIPALPGVVLAFLPVKPGIANMLIPTFGQQLLINQLMRGEPLNPLYVSISTVATLLAALVCILISMHLYQQERILLGAR